MTHTTSEFIVKMLLFKKNSPDSLDSLAEIIDFLIFFGPGQISIFSFLVLGQVATIHGIIFRIVIVKNIKI
jgi:hypothetical protein